MPGGTTGCGVLGRDGYGRKKSGPVAMFLALKRPVALPVRSSLRRRGKDRKIQPGRQDWVRGLGRRLVRGLKVKGPWADTHRASHEVLEGKKRRARRRHRGRLFFSDRMVGRGRPTIIANHMGYHSWPEMQLSQRAFPEGAFGWSMGNAIIPHKKRGVRTRNGKRAR